MENPDLASTLQELGIDRLSVDDRIAVAQEIWDSVEQEVEHVELTLLQRDGLERRPADSVANPTAMVPWEEVKARALARARK